MLSTRYTFTTLRAKTLVSKRYKTSFSNHLDSNYQFLQRSKLPTMYFQPSLPRLPIPHLEKTCERYLAALRPLLIDESYQKSQDVVNRFKANTGQQLQKMLKAKDTANKHTSYISEPWFDMYLRDRVPLPINYNPLMALKHDSRKEYNDQLIRTTNLVISSLRFMRSLRAECLEPEVFHLNPKKSDTEQFRTITKLAPTAIATYVAYAFKAFPLDMSQYSGLFGATRIPELDKDRIYRNAESRHILIMRKGNIYSVDVLDASGNIEAPNVILGRIKKVIVDETAAAQHPVGVLTATDRNSWASLRHHAVEIGNKQVLKAIDSALFCVCLDDITYDEANPIPLLKTFLAGDGTNRWFDKSVSFFVGKDGTTAINFEHSWGDGVAVLRYFNEIYKDSTTSPFVHPDTTPNTEDADSTVRLINLHLDDRLKQGIEDARVGHKKTLDSLDLEIIRYKDLNRTTCKALGVSPDSVIQLAFQLAFKQEFGKLVGTYESCSTAAFRHGRTETMRPCTTATKEFCDAVLKKDRPSIGELQEMIRTCSTVHGNLTKEAAMGQGFDRHLFGLRNMAEQNDMKIPSIFQDSAYKLINYNIISTSTLGSPALLAGGFGPVVKDGLGIGYNISNEECGAVVSSYHGKRDGRKFVSSLNDAFNTIKDILSAKV